MHLSYHNPLEESEINLTDYKGRASQEFLKEKNLYKIIWAKRGPEKMTIDGCTFDLEKNQVVFCTALNQVEMTNPTGHLEAIVFNREFYCIRDNDEEVSCNGFLFYGSAAPIVIKLDKKEQRQFYRIYSIFEEEFQIKDKSQGEMIRAMLKRLIIKSTRLAKRGMVKGSFSEEKFDLLRKYHILVEKNFRNHHQVTDYARFLNKSPKTISNLFKKHCDKTPLTIINDRILLEARRLLLFSHKTAEEIAFELGFNEAGHFSKFFHNKMECSPISFRKSALGRRKGKNLQ